MPAKRLVLLSILLTLLSVNRIEPARGRESQGPPVVIDGLDHVALAELTETNSPGVAIGIVVGDRLVLATGFGVSNVETGTPVKPDMLFRLGSTTKMFTAAALIKLAEAGKLKIDEPIGRYTKGLDPAIAKLTATQLLSHTGGLKDNAVMFGKHDDRELGETVRALKADALFTTPGRVHSYSNPGYWLAGYVIEQVSGRAYADELSESLFKPLGMSRTTLRPTMAMTFPLALGHQSNGREKPQVVRPFADNAGNWPAGSMFSSVNDLSRFVIAFMNDGQLDGKQVLSKSLIATLTAAHSPVPGSEGSYGFGLSVSNVGGVKVVQHGGSRSGFGSLIRMLPEQRVAVILLINRSGGSLPKTADKATAIAFPAWRGDGPQPAPRDLTAVEMARYAGVYGEGTNRIELAIKAGVLLFRRGSTEDPVKSLSESRLVAIPNGASARISFGVAFDAKGKAEFLLVGGRAVKRAE